MCLLFGGYLIEVDDTNEYSFIQGYLNEHGQEEGSCFFSKEHHLYRKFNCRF